MNLKTVLTTDTVNLHLKGTTKEAIIDELLDILVQAGKVKDKTAARACVLDRERKMSTGMKHGIRITSYNVCYTKLLRKSAPVPFPPG